MKETFNSKGYNFRMASTDEWSFTDGNELYHGSFVQVMAYAVLKYGFRMEDLEDGVEMMLAADADGIHFGMYKTAIYPIKKVA